MLFGVSSSIFGYLRSQSLDNAGNLVIVFYLHLLVVTAALVRCAFLENFGKTIIDLSLSAIFLALKILFVVFHEPEVDFVLF